MARLIYDGPADGATPDPITLYIAELASRCNAATIERRLVAIWQTHQGAR